MKILGKKTLWWRIKYMTIAPLWLILPGAKKTWIDFKYGMMSHECNYSDRIIDEPGSTYIHYRCNHTGCNILSSPDFQPGGEYYETKRLQPQLQELYDLWNDTLWANPVGRHAPDSNYVIRETDDYEVTGQKDHKNIMILLKFTNVRFELWNYPKPSNNEPITYRCMSASYKTITSDVMDAPDILETSNTILKTVRV